MTPGRSETGFPRFSRPERARRFAAVRARMTRQGVDAIVIRSDSAKWDSGSAEGRYLTHIGGNGEEGYTVFDLREDPLFVIWGPGHIPNWRAQQDWTTDIRPGVPSAAHVVAARIRELGLERGRIGLVGRAAGPLTPDGRWPQLAYDTLRAELDQATLIDFDDEMAAVRAIKSDEEIACHERAMEMTEQAIEVMYTHARAGVSGVEVAGRMVGALVCAGSDMSVMVQLNVGPDICLASRLTPDRPLVPGDVLLNEITGKCHGYWSQAHAPVAVGSMPPRYGKLFDVTLEGLLAGQAALAPGITTHELAEIIRTPARRAGCHWSPIPTVKGIGMSTSEFPMSPPADATVTRSPHIEEAMVITVQPAAYDRDAGIGLHIAETFVVTGDGRRRLGRRKFEFRVV
jgi:Xaa-Pro aminopeptidase